MRSESSLSIKVAWLNQVGISPKDKGIVKAPVFNKYGP
jgi:hypothetical protein